MKKNYLTLIITLLSLTSINVKSQNLSIKDYDFFENANASLTTSGGCAPADAPYVDESCYIAYKVNSTEKVKDLTIVLCAYENYQGEVSYSTDENYLNGTYLGDLSEIVYHGEVIYPVNDYAKYILIKGIKLSDLNAYMDIYYVNVTLTPPTIYTTAFNYDYGGNMEQRRQINMKSGNGESLQQNQLPDTYVSDYLGSKNVKIYPNPTRGELAIELTELPESPVEVLLYDFSGKLVKSGTLHESFFLLDINNKPDGNYLLRLTTGTSQKTYQVIKK